MAYGIRYLAISSLLLIPLRWEGTSYPIATDGLQEPIGQISGVVVDGGTKRPIDGASVSLRVVSRAPAQFAIRSSQTVPPSPSRALTASNGTFAFRGVVAGEYVITATRPGYAFGMFGQQSPRDEFQHFDLREGENAVGVTIRLWPGASIAGTVRSEGAGSGAGKWISALELISDNGVVVINSLQTSTLTDDQGNFRLSGLPSGRYIVKVSSSTPAPLGSSTPLAKLDPSCVFYPNAGVPVDADIISLTPGEERTHVDFALQLPRQNYQMAGRISGIPFSRVPHQLRLIVKSTSPDFPSLIEVGATTVGSDGTFAFPFVPKGRFHLRGVFSPDPPAESDVRQSSTGWRLTGGGVGGPIPPLPTQPTTWIDEEVTVTDKSLLGLDLHARSGSRVLGRVVLAPDASDVDLSRVAITAQSLDGWNLEGLPVGRIEADGRFSTNFLPAGRYLVEPRGSGDWYAESVVVGSRNARETGIDLSAGDAPGFIITVTKARAHLSGQVTDVSGQVRSDAYVLFFRRSGTQALFPVPGGTGDAGRVRTNRFGHYDLPMNVGDYFILAILGDVPDAWRDRDFLQSLVPNATKLSMSRGMTLSSDLVARPLRK